MMITYTSTVHSIVDASELLHHQINHGLHAGLVRDIHLDSKCLEVGMLGVLLTFLRSLFSALLIQIRKGNALYTGLCKRKGSLFADSGRGLYMEEISLCEGTTGDRARTRLRTPVMRAKPVLSIILDVIAVWMYWEE